MTTKPRYFYVYYGGKIVREITWEEWRKIAREDWRAKRTRLIIRIDNVHFYIRKGTNCIWIRGESINKILKKLEEKEKK